MRVKLNVGVGDRLQGKWGHIAIILFADGFEDTLLSFPLNDEGPEMKFMPEIKYIVINDSYYLGSVKVL